MESFYYAVFAVLAILVAGLLFTQREQGSIVPSSGANVSTFLKLRNNYLFVYAMMMGALPDRDGWSRMQGRALCCPTHPTVRRRPIARRRLAAGSIRVRAVFLLWI